MVYSVRITPFALVVLWPVLLTGHAGCVQDQAPGDGVAICTEETINGMANPFFANRPVYSASERPLMDSRDYNRLLQESGDAYLPWQRLDRDNNNTNDVATEVRTIYSHSYYVIIMKLLSSGVKLRQPHVLGQ